MHFEKNQNLKPPVARKLAVRHTSVLRLVFWLLVISSNYFTKFHDFSMITQVFPNSMIIPCMELFYRFSRFSMISRACGNPEIRINQYICRDEIHKLYFVEEIQNF